MTIEVKMPALSPTMEEGTIARWLVKEGDKVAAGDLIAEIETDKATMEFEAVDEGRIARILVDGGSSGVKVGTVIALIEDEEGAAISPPSPAPAPAPTPAPAPAAAAPTPAPAPAPVSRAAPAVADGARLKVSPLARRLAQGQGIDLAALNGTGPGGRIVKADVDAAAGKAGVAPAAVTPAAAPVAVSMPADVPYETVRLSSMRKTIARRLTESKQTVPHFYLTVDCNLDPLLRLRADLNASLEARGFKLSVNDLLVKALAVALLEVPDANVQFAGDELLRFKRADISVAVAIPGGLITPIIADASAKGVATIARESRDLAERARAGKLQPHEYLGGTASISNLGMYGIKQFDAVINPPQGMILAVGAGEKRPHIVDDALVAATVMTATGSFDHRAIDGAVGAELMQAFKRLVERPLGMLA